VLESNLPPRQLKLRSGTASPHDISGKGSVPDPDRLYRNWIEPVATAAAAIQQLPNWAAAAGDDGRDDAAAAADGVWRGRNAAHSTRRISRAADVNALRRWSYDGRRTATATRMASATAPSPSRHAAARKHARRRVRRAPANGHSRSARSSGDRRTSGTAVPAAWRTTATSNDGRRIRRSPQKILDEIHLFSLINN
ncbi:hypothetical protein PENTCL1PPCAC_15999, partial [Pristionchus entomophagus]